MDRTSRIIFTGGEILWRVHVEKMGFLGIGNNPMVGCTVACAVQADLYLNKK